MPFWSCKFKRDGESMDLLLNCEVACTLWNAFFSCVGLSWVMSKKVVDLLACWRGLISRTHNIAMEDGVFVPFVMSFE
jgi:hypothetical protein